MKKKNTPSLNVLQEQVNIDKKIVESGKVVIHKKVHKEDKDVEVPVSHEEVEIKKVTVNKYVTEAPDVRYEGNTTIIPVIKEVAVIEKKLLLVEEIHVIKHVVEKTEEHIVPLRKEEIQVEHYTRKSSQNS
ncbi:MAG TPA: YsnF/AvaK domain-containing protein [Parafilimonas sp.]|nr:YsnF/AvaK domain-containing protein [Parafilimonas sp.]